MFGLYIFLSKLPKILVFAGFVYLLVRVIRAFIRDCIVEREGSFFAAVCKFLDPYRQSIFYYKHKLIALLGLIIVTYGLYLLFVPPNYIVGEKGLYVAHNLMYNEVTYFINYLVHENLGHNMFCTFGQNWLCYFSGDFIQILIPCIVYLFSLQLRGGLFFSPIIFYWLASAIYDAGAYVSDVVVNKLALTSSDMVTDCKAGDCAGDWYYILSPFDGVSYGETIGLILEIIACFIFALALYSIIEYIRRLMQKGLYE